jgi:hypothetical protein
MWPIFVEYLPSDHTARNLPELRLWYRRFATRAAEIKVKNSHNEVFVGAVTPMLLAVAVVTPLIWLNAHLQVVFLGSYILAAVLLALCLAWASWKKLSVKTLFRVLLVSAGLLIGIGFLLARKAESIAFHGHVNQVTAGQAEQFAPAVVGFTIVALTVAYLAAVAFSSWHGGRAWRREPGTGAVTELISILAKLDVRETPNTPFVFFQDKLEMMVSLRAAGNLIQSALPRRVSPTDGPERAIFVDRCRLAGASVRELSLWIALPRHDTHEEIRKQISLLVATLITGRYDELPTFEPIHATVPQRIRRIGQVLRTLAVGAAPLAAMYVGTLLGLSLSGVYGNGLLIFSIFWAIITYLSLIDPLFLNRIANIRDLISTVRSTNTKH